MENRELPFLTNYGLMLTYKCSVACPHCIVKAGPNRKEEMKPADALKWIDQIDEYSRNRGITPGISLTGGEPFYNEELMKRVADYAAEKRFIVSVVTNAFWADSREKALDTLSKFSSVKLVSVSTDKYHLENIPLSNIRNAVYSCKKLGKEYNIAVAARSEEDEEYLHLIDQLLEFTEKEKIETALIVSVGRAEKQVKTGDLEQSEEPPQAACSMASFPILFPNGKVIACIGPPIVLPDFNPLYLGNLRRESLLQILDRAENNFILHAIRTFGPSFLVKQLRDKGYGELLPRSFRAESICDVCNKLFSGKEICQALEEVAADEKFRERVAYGRFYYLDEPAMIESIT